MFRSRYIKYDKQIGKYLRHRIESEAGLSVPVNIIAFYSYYIQKECITQENPVKNESYADARIVCIKRVDIFCKPAHKVVLFVLNVAESC